MLVFVAVMLFWTFSARKYRGDGILTDNGLLSTYTRYQIHFHQVSLAKPGEYKFVCEGLPSVPLTFELEMADMHKHDEEQRAFLRQHPNQKWPGTGEKDRYEDIKRNRTLVEFRLSTDGETVCSNSGSLKDSWILGWTPSSNSGSFWQSNCLDIQFNPNRRYRLALTIKEVDADALPVMVVPKLSGGGMELP
jgi:hypothetical protein